MNERFVYNHSHLSIALVGSGLPTAYTLASARVAAIALLDLDVGADGFVLRCSGGTGTRACAGGPTVSESVYCV